MYISLIEPYQYSIISRMFSYLLGSLELQKKHPLCAICTGYIVKRIAARSRLIPGMNKEGSCREWKVKEGLEWMSVPVVMLQFWQMNNWNAAENMTVRWCYACLGWMLPWERRGCMTRKRNQRECLIQDPLMSWWIWSCRDDDRRRVLCMHERSSPWGMYNQERIWHECLSRIPPALDGSSPRRMDLEYSFRRLSCRSCLWVYLQFLFPSQNCC